MVDNRTRARWIFCLCAVLVISLGAAHLTSSAAVAERERENKLIADVVEAKVIKVGGITIASDKNYSGIWLSNESSPGAVNLYITKEQGPCIGIHRNKDLTANGTSGYDLALTAKDGEPVVQYRKTDGTLGHLTVKELEKVVQSKK